MMQTLANFAATGVKLQQQQKLLMEQARAAATAALPPESDPGDTPFALSAGGRNAPGGKWPRARFTLGSAFAFLGQLADKRASP